MPEAMPLTPAPLRALWSVGRYRGNEPEPPPYRQPPPTAPEPEAVEAPAAPVGTFIPLEDLRQRRWATLRGRPAHDLSGQVFGLLTVLSRSLAGRGARAGAQWVCECACGGRAVCSSQELRGGRRTSCGCQPQPHRPVGRPRIHPRPAAPFADPCDVALAPRVRAPQGYLRPGKRETKVTHFRGAAGWRRAKRAEAAAMSF